MIRQGKEGPKKWTTFYCSRVSCKDWNKLMLKIILQYFFPHKKYYDGKKGIRSRLIFTLHHTQIIQLICDINENLKNIFLNNRALMLKPHSHCLNLFILFVLMNLHDLDFGKILLTCGVSAGVAASL